MTPLSDRANSHPQIFLKILRRIGLIDVQTIGVLIAAVSVVIGVILGVIQLREIDQSRQAETLHAVI